MISGGNATINVANLEKAIDFYTRVLGLKLLRRYDDSFATIDAGNGLVLGLSPAPHVLPGMAAAGQAGSISVGLEVTLPLEAVVQKLKRHDVTIAGDIVEDRAAPARRLFITDPDGNSLYLAEAVG